MIPGAVLKQYFCEYGTIGAAVLIGFGFMANSFTFFARWDQRPEAWKADLSPCCSGRYT